MATYIAVSGPCHSGKSTLMSILKDRYSHVHSVHFLGDLHDEVWEDLVKSSKFGRFEEIYKDRDYLLLYCIQLVKKYTWYLDAYSKADDSTLVVLDGCYLDLLIYMILHLWYHYPSHEVQAKVVNDLLKGSNRIRRIFMVKADDSSYPVQYSTTTLRQRMANFKRNRELELNLYDTYRSNIYVEDCTSSVYANELTISHWIDQFIEDNRL